MLQIHQHLSKTESSMLVQLRTTCIGLKAFLIEKRVPGEGLSCECGQARETVTHIIAFCPAIRAQRLRLREALGHDDVARAL